MISIGLAITGYLVIGLIGMICVLITFLICYKNPKNIKDLPEKQQNYVLHNDVNYDKQKTKRTFPANFLFLSIIWPVSIPLMLGLISKENNDVAKRYEEVTGGNKS